MNLQTTTRPDDPQPAPFEDAVALADGVRHAASFMSDQHAAGREMDVLDACYHAAQSSQMSRYMLRGDGISGAAWSALLKAVRERFAAGTL